MIETLPVERKNDLTFHEQLGVIVECTKEWPQIECPLTHRFAPGIYLREIFMPADTIVIGKLHLTEHFNVLLKGSCMIVHDNGKREILTAPHSFVSKPGVQKVLYILEDMIWQTIHATDETDPAKVELAIISQEPPNERICAEVARLRQELIA